MNPDIEITELKPDFIISRVTELSAQGWRLVQMSASTIQGEGEAQAVELNYSFDKDYKLLNLRVFCQTGSKIKSISGIFFGAFLYENEIKEQFGVEFEGIAIDFRGTLYKTAVKQPFIAFAPKKAAVPPQGGAQ